MNIHLKKKFPPSGFSFNFLVVLLFLGCLALPGPGWEARAAQVTLAWDPNSEPDLAGYKVYLGTATRSYVSVVDVGNTTSYTLLNLIQGETYFFCVTAYNTQGYESDYSNEVNKSVVRQFQLQVKKRGSGAGTISAEGIRCGSDCSGVYDEGSLVSVTVSPEKGSVFTGWSGDDCSGIGECVLTMWSDKSLTAGLVGNNNGIAKKNKVLYLKSTGSSDGTQTPVRRAKGSLVADATEGGETSVYVITKRTDRRGASSGYYSLNGGYTGLRSKFASR